MLDPPLDLLASGSERSSAKWVQAPPVPYPVKRGLFTQKSESPDLPRRRWFQLGARCASRVTLCGWYFRASSTLPTSRLFAQMFDQCVVYSFPAWSRSLRIPMKSAGQLHGRD